MNDVDMNQNDVSFNNDDIDGGDENDEQCIENIMVKCWDRDGNETTHPFRVSIPDHVVEEYL